IKHIEYKLNFCFRVNAKLQQPNGPPLSEQSAHLFQANKPDQGHHNSHLENNHNGHGQNQLAVSSSPTIAGLATFMPNVNPSANGIQPTVVPAVTVIANSNDGWTIGPPPGHDNKTSVNKYYIYLSDTLY